MMRTPLTNRKKNQQEASEQGAFGKESTLFLSRKISNVEETRGMKPLATWVIL
ncbi:MAG: hypothetical protein ACO1QB_13525 [Verrucomicrobiales bacterium]